MRSLTMIVKDAQNSIEWINSLKAFRFIKYFKRRKTKRIISNEFEDWLDNKDKLGELYAVDLLDAYNMIKESNISWYIGPYENGERFNFQHDLRNPYGLPSVEIYHFVDGPENKVSIKVTILNTKKRKIAIEFESIKDPFRLLERSKKQGNGNLTMGSAINSERITITTSSIKKDYKENTKDTIVLEGVYHMIMIYIKTAMEIFVDRL